MRTFAELESNEKAIEHNPLLIKRATAFSRLSTATDMNA